MTFPVDDPVFWTNRYKQAMDLRPDEPHRIVYDCSPDLWKKVERRHRDIIQKVVSRYDTVVDVGCGYGHALEMLPDCIYMGVDLSQEMIDLARKTHPEGARRRFICGDIKIAEVCPKCFRFDWALLISVKEMYINNLGLQKWWDMELAVRKIARRMLILEYSESDLEEVQA